MKLRNYGSKKQAMQTLLGIALVCGLTLSAKAQGTWTALTNKPPETIGPMLQLMDGRVLASGGNSGSANNTWYTLTPDAFGSYANGTWTQVASMASKRLFYAMKVLPNGDVLICGGEFTDGPGQPNINLCERYNPQTNKWSSVPTPKYGIKITDNSGNMKKPGDVWANIGAAMATELPSGLVLLADLGTPTSALYDYTTNSWTPVNNPKANGGESSDEENWTLLPDGSIITVDCVTNDPITHMPPVGFNYTQRFDPNTLTWVSQPHTPSQLVDAASELGPGMLLYNGLTIYIGALTHTALYDYKTGMWVAGPDQYGTDKTKTLGSVDGPGCVEINGKALLCVGPTGNGEEDAFPNGQRFLEYTYSAAANSDGSYGSFLEVAPPAGFDPSMSGSFSTKFLQLPNGQILFTDANTTNQLYVYTPQGPPVAGAAPIISSITNNGDGSFLLQGTQLNGLTEGAYYGDDAQMSTNYPLVRFTDSAIPAHVYYGRTSTPSTMGLATGNTPVSVSFMPPATLPSGTYSLEVVANGIPSPPTTITVTTPTLTSMTPTTVNAGGGSVTLTLTGSRFSPSSQVKWNGSTNLTTTFVSATSLKASVPAALVASAGSASVTVFNSTQGGGTSAAQTLNIIGVPQLAMTVNSVTRGTSMTGSMVTVNFTLKNVGTADAANVYTTQATLFGTGGSTVNIPAGPYTLSMGGGSVTGSATFASVAASKRAFQLYGSAAGVSFSLSTAVTVP